MRDNARKQLADKIDPGLAKQVSKRGAKEAAENSFEMIACEWFTKYSSKWSPNHGERILRRLEKDIFPWIGKRPIAEITAPELLTVLRRMESRRMAYSSKKNEDASNTYRSSFISSDQDFAGTQSFDWRRKIFVS